MKNATIKTASVEEPLRKGHSLLVSKEVHSDIIQVRNDKGVSLFTIAVTNKGTELTIAAEHINIVANKTLSLASDAIHITSNGSMKIQNDGDFEHEISGNKNMLTQGESIDKAKTQTIIADLGDVKVKANDDVKLNGERVKMNCD